MNAIKVNDLEIGPTPRVVGTISARSCLELFPSECRDLCDIAEVRLDEIGIYDGWLDACKGIEAVNVPVMVTLRSASEGGKCDRNNEERLMILKQALGSASIVDVEHNSKLAEKIKDDVNGAGKALLVSYHDFNATPSRQVIEKVISEAGKHASIVKIATMVKTDADLSTLQAVLSEKREVPLCLIGMGSHGTRTRTSFPCMGSCLTYGYLDFVSAPGQLSARHLVNHLRQVHPGYNGDFIIRHELMECV